MLNLLALLLWPGTNGGTPPVPSLELLVSDTRLVPDDGRTALVCDDGRTFLTPD